MNVGGKSEALDDAQDFGALVGADVQRKHHEHRIALSSAKPDEQTLLQRRVAAEAEVSRVLDPLGGDPVRMLAPLEEVSYRRDGVQHGVFKNLRLGKYVIDARLDLHKMTVERARQVVYQFVQDCVEHDVRTALITHGKGEGRDQAPTLKSHVAHWLPQMDVVLAFHTALKQHGGYGATYVLLRKSEKKKQQTREQFQRS